MRVRYTDTVGFIRKLPHDLVASFRATLEEAAGADVVLHVVDASHPAWEEQAEVVGEALAGVLADRGRVPRVVVALNKTDLLGPEEAAARSREAEGRGWRAILTSATEGRGIAELLAASSARRPA